ncbi:Peptidoglycan endopeptidase LytF precursor [compost metagenome]
MGRPYVWGGRRPEHGGFDCSGILEYSFNKIGINMYGTAQVQYNKTVPVNPSEALPGDLVFWVTKGSAPTHVGMYLGNDKFINSNNSHGLSISSINTWNRLYPFLGYRRIVK